MKPKILVVGSLAMDLIITTRQFCNGGETVIGTGFSTAPGGKGANQAVQAARLGADVTLIGKVGNDDFGRALIASVKESGVNTDSLLITTDVPTGIANIQIQKNEQGTENRILVVPGANFALTVEDVACLEESIAEYDMVILQHEIPTEVNCKVAAYAKAKGVPVLLNPAPSAPISKELTACLTYIAPNEHEAEDITGIPLDSPEATLQAVEALHQMGIPNVIITLGKEGCIGSDGVSVRTSPSMDIAPVIDPTAAGDSFIGAFCTAIATGTDVEDAFTFANCTAGITVTRMGAQTSLPTLEEVLTALQEKGVPTKAYSKLKTE